MTDHELFNLAAKAALRGMGDVEPNPMVGAVISRDGVVLGIGHHRRFGGLHAEREAIANARARGHDLRGATIHVTLEPCAHFGRQPPCVDAILEAGFARVVMAQHDPHTVSAGGAARLRSHGVQVDLVSHEFSIGLADAFLRRVAPSAEKAGLPWVIAKWAQWQDGRMTSGPGDPRWISCAASRRRVHRLRAVVEAVVTGVGTVIADDPMLTARDVARVRRPAKRVVLDTHLRTPLTSKVTQSASEVMTIVITTDQTLRVPQGQARRFELEDRGVVVRSVKSDAAGRPDVRAALPLLAGEFACVNVMLECGQELLTSSFAASVVDQALVHIAPGEGPMQLAAGRDLRILRDHRVGVDRELLLGRQ
jgi:diaminohydroxyphosphoribosylaminopyrimidine deaminase/5-amino-6-(5-phosphoribosylamino)uracil reductase